MAPRTETVCDDSFVTAMALCEVRNLTERADFGALVESVGRHGRARLLADGLLAAYLIRLPIDGVDLLAAMHVTLRNGFVFGQVIMPIPETTLATIECLSEDTLGEFYPIQPCALCGKEAPFPAVVWVRGEDGKRREAEGVYCDACAVNISDSPSEPGATAAPAATEKVAVAA